MREAGLEVMEIGAESDNCPLTMPNAHPSEASSHQLIECMSQITRERAQLQT